MLEFLYEHFFILIYLVLVNIILELGTTLPVKLASEGMT